MVTARGTRFWQVATGLVSVAVLTVLTTGGIFLAVGNNELRGDLTIANSDLRASTLNAEDLYRQLISEGIAPEAEKPSNVVKGDAGSDGARGMTGAAGSNGANGANGLPGLDGATGISGGSGADGANGSDGATGAAGEDGADGADGAPGADGTNGTNGTNGADGVASPPRPSVTFITDKGPVTCTLTDATDPSAPIYTCVDN